MSNKIIRIDNNDIIPGIIPDQIKDSLEKYQKMYRWFAFDFFSGNIIEAVDNEGKYHHNES